MKTKLWRSVLTIFTALFIIQATVACDLKKEETGALGLLALLGLGNGGGGGGVSNYTVGGTVSGLSGTVELQNNGGDDLIVAADSSFTFVTGIADKSTYAVTVLNQPSGQICSVSNGAGTVSGNNISNVTVICSTDTYTIGGTVSGLTGTVVLQNNNGDDLTVNANGSFTFATAVANGSPYTVAVNTQPSGQSCSVSNGVGTIAGADIGNVAVTCASNMFTLGGTVSGLSGTVVLQNNNGDNLTVNVNGSFDFATAVADGSTYAVTVLTQPIGQTCSVSTGSGTVSGNSISNVAVICSANAYTVGGTVSGLSGSVVLQDNSGDNLTVSANGAYTFATSVAYGSPYSVTVLTQPAGQSCSVANGTGTISTANISNVAVTCSSNTYIVGGTVSGLSGSVVLQDNNGDNLTISANGTFTFATSVAYGSPYSVTVLTQPAGQSCSIANGTGTIATTNVSNVAITCSTNTHTIGGTVSGLNGSMVLQNNLGDNLTVATNGTFTFTTAVSYGTPYSVTILSQQFTNQACTISNGNGTVTGNVSNVAVTCVRAAYDVTIVATGVSSGGAWVGNTWTASAANATVLASEIEAHLLNGVTTINNWSGGGTQSGDITVSGSVSWSANTLTLSAARHITINATMTGTTGTARLALEYGQGAVAAGNHGMYRINTPVNVKSDPNSPLPADVPASPFPTVPGETYAEPNLGIPTFSLKRGSDGTLSSRNAPYCPVSVRNVGYVFHGCAFLTYTSPSALNIRYQTVEHNVVAGTTLWIYIDVNSLYSSTNYPYALAALPGIGTFYYPGSDLQAADIGPGGAVSNWTSLNNHTLLMENGRRWYQGPVHTFFDSSRFPNGYYVAFVPNAGESGYSYNTLSLLVTDLPIGNTGYTVVDHIINVIPAP